MQSETDSVIKMVNDNNYYHNITVYIMKNIPDTFTLEEARKLAKYLIIEQGFSYGEILKGYADYIIQKESALKRVKVNSVLQASERNEGIVLRTIKKFIDKMDLKKVITFILAIVASAVVTNEISEFQNFIDESQLVNDVPQNIGMLAAEEKSEDYVNKRTIVAQNTYQVGFEGNGQPIVAYNSDGIAKDIIMVCNKDASLFDLCLAETYFEMNYNRLQNMEDVFKLLKIYLASDPAFAHLFSQIADCDVFLDYVFKKAGNNKSYPSLLSAINEYKKVGSFNFLSSESQKAIQSLISSFEQQKRVLSSEKAGLLASLVNGEPILTNDVGGGRK